MNDNCMLVEQLDRRLLLSSSVLLHGTLVILGDANKVNTITVALNGSGKVQPVVNGKNLAPRVAANVKKIVIEGGKLSDTIVVDSAVSAKLVILGHAGDDTITVGDQNSLIEGNAGDDVITAGNGNDIVFGGRGKDSITVGNGKDAVFGGRNAGEGDTIHAGDGNDTLFGLSGHDQITAGNGNDRVFAGVKDVVTVGTGTNTYFATSTTATFTANGTAVPSNEIHHLSGFSAGHAFQKAIDKLHLERHLTIDLD